MLSGYSYREIITINSSEVDNVHISPIVKVELSSSNFNFSLTRPDGYDIRFTDSNEDTLLSYQRLSYDVTLERGIFLVRLLENLSPDSDTTFYLYYGKSDATDVSDSTVAYGTAKPKLLFNTMRYRKFRDDMLDKDDLQYWIEQYYLKIDSTHLLEIDNAGYTLIIGG